MKSFLALALLLLLSAHACGDGLALEGADASADADAAATSDGGPGGLPPRAQCEGAAQSGCDTGQKCAVIGGAWTCTTQGRRGLGQICGSIAGKADNCLGGLHCYQGTCQQLCTNANPCAVSAEQCMGIPASASHLGICLSSCDPIIQDCPTTASGKRQGCYIAPSGPVCATVALSPPTAPGSTCRYLNECAIGSGCVDLGSGSQCAAYCDYQANTNAADALCSPLKMCRSLSGSSAAGVCRL